MAVFRDGTPTWVVPGFDEHHVFADCARLKIQRDRAGKPGVASEYNSAAGHTKCNVCKKKLEGIPETS